MVHISGGSQTDRDSLILTSTHSFFQTRDDIGKKRIARGTHQCIRAVEQRAALAARLLVAQVHAELPVLRLGAVQGVRRWKGQRHVRERKEAAWILERQ